MTTVTPRNIKRFLVAASVALAIPLGAAAFQGGPEGHPGCGHFGGHGGPGMGMGMGMGMGGEMMPPHLRGLNLNEAQRDKVFEIMHAQTPVMREKAKALQKAEADLRALATTADYSDAKARALADTAAKAMADMALARTRIERQVFDVLTPEQRKQLADMKAQGMSGRSRGDGPGRGRSDAPRGMSGMGGEAQMPAPPAR